MISYFTLRHGRGIVCNQLYFPAGDPVISTLLAYTTFAVGFVTRPLGGVIFGHFGDRIGRKSMLVPGGRLIVRGHTETARLQSGSFRFRDQLKAG